MTSYSYFPDLYSDPHLDHTTLVHLDFFVIYYLPDQDLDQVPDQDQDLDQDQDQDQDQDPDPVQDPIILLYLDFFVIWILYTFSPINSSNLYNFTVGSMSQPYDRVLTTCPDRSFQWPES
jgi:hypothetical protein